MCFTLEVAPTPSGDLYAESAYDSSVLVVALLLKLANTTSVCDSDTSTSPWIIFGEKLRMVPLVDFTLARTFQAVSDTVYRILPT